MLNLDDLESGKVFDEAHNLEQNDFFMLEKFECEFLFSNQRAGFENRERRRWGRTS